MRKYEPFFRLLRHESWLRFSPATPCTSSSLLSLQTLGTRLQDLEEKQWLEHDGVPSNRISARGEGGPGRRSRAGSRRMGTRATTSRRKR